jgi:hypothetical protein
VGHETEGQGDLAACVADRSLVVDDEEVQKVGGQNLLSRESELQRLTS